MLLIFDFDGVVADSEVVACATAARYATELGAPISDEEGLELFLGRRATDVRSLVSSRGGKAPDNFEDVLLRRTLEAFSLDLKPVAGVEHFLATHADLPRCIASSSSHQRIEASLRNIGLTSWFENRIYSVDDVGRGKPWPDIFLHAAEAQHAEPSSCVVIEDSPQGVIAAVAAGMRVFGLLAGSHMAESQRDVLRQAGADHVVDDYDALAALL